AAMNTSNRAGREWPADDSMALRDRRRDAIKSERQRCDEQRRTDEKLLHEAYSNIVTLISPDRARAMLSERRAGCALYQQKERSDEGLIEVGRERHLNRPSRPSCAVPLSPRPLSDESLVRQQTPTPSAPALGVRFLRREVCWGRRWRTSGQRRPPSACVERRQRLRDDCSSSIAVRATVPIRCLFRYAAICSSPHVMWPALLIAGLAALTPRVGSSAR